MNSKRETDPTNSANKPGASPAHHPMTLSAWSAAAVARLVAEGFDAEVARGDVAAIVRGTRDWDLGAWLAHQREPLTGAAQQELDVLIHRRARHEPVAYLVGHREFYGRSFLVSPAVLIPRPETELLIDIASERLATLRAAGRALRAIDVGTGSGIIATTLALEHPALHVIATDISRAALDVARQNVARHGVASRVDLVETSLTGAIGHVDLVVSNPPYVALDDAPRLQVDVREFEPHTALFGGGDGLNVIRALVPSAAAALVPGGWLVMEIGAGQADEVRALVVDHGLVCLRIAIDLAGHHRVVVAARPDDSL
jgi:release factor glutamine methyltransferase